MKTKTKLLFSRGGEWGGGWIIKKQNYFPFSGMSNNIFFGFLDGICSSETNLVVLNMWCFWNCLGTNWKIPKIGLISINFNVKASLAFYHVWRFFASEQTNCRIEKKNTKCKIWEIICFKVCWFFYDFVWPKI